MQNNPEMVMDDEERGRRLEAMYKGSTANFASIGLYAS
jgi:hypothetical protein